MIFPRKSPRALPPNAVGSVPIVYEAIGAPFLGCCFGPVRNCEVSQLTTIPANELCEHAGAGRWHQLFSLFRLLTLIFEAARRVRS